jgi:hypothetical protein
LGNNGKLKLQVLWALPGSTSRAAFLFVLDSNETGAAQMIKFQSYLIHPIGAWSRYNM